MKMIMKCVKSGIPCKRPVRVSKITESSRIYNFHLILYVLLAFHLYPMSWNKLCTNVLFSIQHNIGLLFIRHR